MESLVLTNSKGQDVTTSLIVAEVFGKEHKHVLRDIESLSCSPEFNRTNFGLISYRDAMNREQRAFEMTKDGFSFLVMGYTGEKAAQFKETFINEFNKRDALLKSDDYIIDRAMRVLFERTKSLEENLKAKQTQLALKERQVELQAETIREIAPKGEYYDEVLQSESSIATTVIAKELGMSAIMLNRLLCREMVIYKVNGVYVLYAKYQNKGLTKPKTFHYDGTSGETKTKIELYWTEQGRKFIHDLIGQKR